MRAARPAVPPSLEPGPRRAPTSRVRVPANATGNRYAAPANGGDTGAAYKAGIAPDPSEHNSRSHSTPARRWAPTAPSSLRLASRRLLVPFVVVRALRLARTLATARRYVKLRGTPFPRRASPTVRGSTVRRQYGVGRRRRDAEPVAAGPNRPYDGRPLGRSTEDNPVRRISVRAWRRLIRVHAGCAHRRGHGRGTTWLPRPSRRATRRESDAALGIRNDPRTRSRRPE